MLFASNKKLGYIRSDPQDMQADLKLYYLHMPEDLYSSNFDVDFVTGLYLSRTDSLTRQLAHRGTCCFDLVITYLLAT